MRILIIVFVGVFSLACKGQNYLGYSKAYIIKALKNERKDMTGPLEVRDSLHNFISYVSKDKKRAIFYYFRYQNVPKNGKTQPTEICYKYSSKNMCESNSKCPEMDDVVRSLDSRFTNAGFHVWIDNSRKIPHEWVLVKEEDYFEVHVTEKKEE